MAIQISGTTVIDNSRNLTNIESIAGNGIATQAEAEAGTNNNQVMTPLRVSQAMSALTGGGEVDSDIDWSTCNVGCAVRGGGNVIRKTGGVIWIVAPSTTEKKSTWPIAYCNGMGGETVYKGRSITGRDGWFIPDLTMLQTAWSCRTYWDTYSTPNVGYWSSTVCETNRCFSYIVRFDTGNAYSNNKTNLCCVRPFRVICY